MTELFEEHDMEEMENGINDGGKEIGMKLVEALYNGYALAMAEADGSGEFVRVGKLTKTLPAFSQESVESMKEHRKAGHEVAVTALSSMGLDVKAIGLEVKLDRFLSLSAELQLPKEKCSEQDIATLMIFEAEVNLELQHHGQTQKFDLPSASYATFFTDCEHVVVRPMNFGYCVVFRLIGNCRIPQELSPWGFYKALLVVNAVLVRWLDDLKHETRRTTKKYVIPLDHEYVTVSFSALRGPDRLAAALLTGNTAIEVHICHIADYTRKNRRYKLTDWVAADDQPVNVRVPNYCFRYEVMEGRDYIGRNAFVVWPRNKRIHNVGFQRFLRSLPVKKGDPVISAAVSDIVNFWYKDPEAFMPNEMDADPNGDDVYLDETQTMLEVMNLCAIAGTRNDCNQMIKILGRSKVYLEERVRSKLVLIVQAHGWQPLESIVELLLVESRAVTEAGNFAALASELSKLSVNDARRSLLAAATAKTAALAVAMKTFELVIREDGVFRKIDSRARIGVASILREFLIPELYMEVEKLMEEVMTVEELAPVAADKNLRTERICRSLKEKLPCGVLSDASLITQLLMIEDEELVDGVVSNVKPQSREQAATFATTKSLTENILLDFPEIWNAASERPLVFKALSDIASDWGACMYAVSESEFTWRQPDANMPGFPILEGLMKGPLETFYYKLETGEPVEEQLRDSLYRRYHDRDRNPNLDRTILHLQIDLERRNRDHLREIVERREICRIKFNGKYKNGVSAEFDFPFKPCEGAGRLVILVRKTRAAYDETLKNIITARRNNFGIICQSHEQVRAENPDQALPPIKSEPVPAQFSVSTSTERRSKGRSRS